MRLLPVEGGPDGINCSFPRAQPFVLYEEPFLQRFRSLHGTDPRELPEDDRDVLELRAAIMSEFMAEARSRTRKHGAELSALVLSDRRSNELHGLDVVRWAREGLLDEIHPTVWDYRRWRVVPEIHHEVPTGRNLLPVKSKNLAQAALQAVPDDRVAQLAADGDSKP